MLDAIKSVLVAYRSTEAHITEDQIQAAWAEYEEAQSNAIEGWKQDEDAVERGVQAMKQAALDLYGEEFEPKNEDYLVVRRILNAAVKR